MDRSEYALIVKDFSSLINDKSIIGIFLFGSAIDVEHPRDVDICLVVGNQDRDQLVEIMTRAFGLSGTKYDVWLFEELNVYIQADVLQMDALLWAEDEGQLYEYLYTFRRAIETYRYRLRVAYDDF